MKCKTFISLMVFLVAALGLTVCVLGDEGDADLRKLNEILDLPALDFETGDSLDDAVDLYERGLLGGAIKKAEALKDEFNSSPEGREGADKMIVLIEKIGSDRMAAAEKCVEEESYGIALHVLEATEKQFGSSNPHGMKAAEKIKEIRDDKSVKDKAGAQYMLIEAKKADADGKRRLATRKYKEVAKTYPDTDEAAFAGKRVEELKKKGGFFKKLSDGSSDDEGSDKKKKIEKRWPFGTVTRDKRIPGDMDCKGDCRNLKQGGYMKFDLTHRQGRKISGASLKVFVKETKKNPWLWITLLDMDPTTAPVQDVFNAIQAHKDLVSGVRKAPAGKWFTFPLKSKGVNRINELIEKGEKFVAMSLTFE